MKPKKPDRLKRKKGIVVNSESGKNFEVSEERSIDEEFKIRNDMDNNKPDMTEEFQQSIPQETDKLLQKMELKPISGK